MKIVAEFVLEDNFNSSELYPMYFLLSYHPKSLILRPG